MMPEQKSELRELQPPMTAEAVTLISGAMNSDEGEWAGVTIARHFDMRAKDLDDGRRYFALIADGVLAGLTGLHHYEWGPAENVWLGWFAVSPGFQGRGIGTLMMRETEKTAKALGYGKLFIETYDTPTFAKAIRFYRKAGFSRAGEIENYLPDGSKMLVFMKRL